MALLGKRAISFIFSMKAILTFLIILLSCSSLSAQWQERIVTEQAVSPKKVIAADIDGDGWLDIVSMNFEKIEGYRNLGDGNFSEGILVGELIDGRDIAVGDIDGDGDRKSTRSELQSRENLVC